jgi:hypothetical protein
MEAQIADLRHTLHKLEHQTLNRAPYNALVAKIVAAVAELDVKLQAAKAPAND